MSDYAIFCICLLAAYIVRTVANGLGARAVVERVALLWAVVRVARLAWGSP